MNYFKLLKFVAFNDKLATWYNDKSSLEILLTIKTKTNESNETQNKIGCYKLYYVFITRY